MSQDTIRIFLRVKPSRKPSGFFKLHPEHSLVEFEPPEEELEKLSGHARNTHRFRFDGLLDASVTQDDVFSKVAKSSVESVLEGFNSTIFAYGQTGSGKTFTITGGPARYEDRGIIPRALAHMFAELERRKEEDATFQFKMYVSYLEIYNESGYDLLDPGHELKSIEELPRVSLLEDEDGNVHLRGLSMHMASDEEEALNLLFLGDTNRAICETPMNPVSSRSHCIFTVSLEQRQEGSAVVRRSKLHLVDLAGSERAHKTGTTGQLFREATHINTSLHFLAMVIGALRDRAGHVPYRNSMVTSVLRDSLGGNCRTAMVATMNPEREYTDESVSTCRFAQSVARVKNEAVLNVETDPRVLVQQLKAQVRSLEAEARFLRGEAGEGDSLTSSELNAVREACLHWIAASERGAADVPPQPDLGDLSLVRIRAAFGALRDLALDARNRAREALENNPSTEKESAPKKTSEPSESTSAAAPEETRALRRQLAQRDSEIAILVGMVKELKGRLRDAGLSDATGRGDSASSSHRDGSFSGGGGAAFSGGGGAAFSGGGGGGGGGGATATKTPSSKPASGPVSPAVAASHAATAAAVESAGKGEPTVALPDGRNVPVRLLSDKKEAFEIWKGSYSNLESVEKAQTVLRELYAEAKRVGQEVNATRSEIARLRNELDASRGKAAEEGDDDAEPAQQDDLASRETVERIEALKEEYHAGYLRLKDLKREIVPRNRSFEAAYMRMNAEFESWFTTALIQAGSSSSSSTTSSAPPPSAAVPQTGDAQVDEDVAAFLRARDRLVAKRKK